jgi:hypothetical protein
MRRLGIAVPLVALALAAPVGLSGQAAGGPKPLRGVPLQGATNLRLVVADKPPFVLDVDTGTRTPVPGFAVGPGTVGVVGVGGRDAVVVARSGPDPQMFAVRDRGTRLADLGRGVLVWPADGGAVWVQDSVDGSGCTLRLVTLDGEVIRAPRAFPCATASDPVGGSLGLVVNRTRVLDPVTGRTVVETRWGVVAAAGRKLVLAGPGERFTLLDAPTRSQRRLPWPSLLRSMDQPAVDPRGRLIALAFADPAWNGSGAQVLDVWLLDTETAKLTQLPGMPAFVSIKFTSMAWTDDGRLVILAETRGKGTVAVWRPGQRRLAVRPVRLTRRTGGSDAFAPLE